MATLSNLRTHLETLTGRKGLATDDPTTCNRVINSACRYLESLQDNPQSQRRHVIGTTTATSGTYVLDVQDCRAVTRVWIANGTSLAELAYIEYDNARREGLISQTFTAGQPEAYAIVPAGRSPAQEGDGSTTYIDSTEYVADGVDDDVYGDIKFGLMFQYTRLLILPPTDGTWTFDILGKFWPVTLDSTYTSNWWTVNFPDTVAYAAAMVLEWERRNREAALDWMDAAKAGLKAVDVMLVENEMAPYEDVSEAYMHG